MQITSFHAHRDAKYVLVNKITSLAYRRRATASQSSQQSRPGFAAFFYVTIHNLILRHYLDAITTELDLFKLSLTVIWGAPQIFAASEPITQIYHCCAMASKCSQFAFLRPFKHFFQTLFIFTFHMFLSVRVVNSYNWTMIYLFSGRVGSWSHS